ncbi:MAG: ubiquitin-like protein Pup [Nitrospirae bacterium]|nr:ubiquitin-like protein Pup [Nitrospirota bacterium]
MRRPNPTDGEEAVQANVDYTERRRKLLEAIDQTVDEIDEVMEENAEVFVMNYLQKPGSSGEPHLSPANLSVGLQERLFYSSLEVNHDYYGKFAQDFHVTGVSVVIFLAQEHEAPWAHLLHKRTNPKVYALEGFPVIRLPFPKGGAPSQVDLANVLRKTIAHLRRGHHVAIHASARLNRVALFVTCLMNWAMGWSGEKAISWVRLHIPGAVVPHEQPQVIRGISPHSFHSNNGGGFTNGNGRH